MPSEYEPAYLDEYARMIYDRVAEALKGENLRDGEWKAIADGVSLVGRDISEVDEMRLGHADVLTRIHSPNFAHAVDVHLFYSSHIGGFSSSLMYALGFRVLTTPAPPQRQYLPKHQEVDKMHTARGWQQFGWFFIDERESEHSACPILRTDLQRVHDVLFGAADSGSGLGARVGLRATTRLLLASVGIKYTIATTDEEKSRGDDEQTGGMFRHLLGGEKPGISASHLRKICGIASLKGDGESFWLVRQIWSLTGPLARVPDMADLTKVQVTAPEEYFEDDYDDDSGDDDDEMDEGDYASRGVTFLDSGGM
ncbi:hypothetical protein EVG20_g11441 [Dentipellis fragilis]|uniref:Uncharacterized protein n=1 Tax=Dentipellis fragilis TaxID=205917 RepID=A0A4Y9XPY8_9AGAM|nr:hypothetical protein EVG20_g11441 [Dentipellis fragilis]